VAKHKIKEKGQVKEPSFEKGDQVYESKPGCGVGSIVLYGNIVYSIVWYPNIEEGSYGQYRLKIKGFNSREL
jgi:hypothetical protein